MSKARKARGLVPARAVSLLLFAAVLPQLAMAQALPSPTAEQLEVFRNLPPDQQRAVLKAVTGAAKDAQQSEAPLSTPQVGAPVNVTPPSAEPGPPRIDGAVTLVLDVSAKDTDEQVLAATLASRRDRILASNP